MATRGRWLEHGEQSHGYPAERLAGGGGADPAAHPRPVRPGRADGERTGSHHRPKPTQRVAPSQAALRGRPPGPGARGQLGLSRTDRGRSGRRDRAAPQRPAAARRPGSRPRHQTPGRGQGGTVPGGGRLFPPQCPALGRAAVAPRRRWRSGGRPQEPPSDHRRR